MPGASERRTYRGMKLQTIMLLAAFAASRIGAQERPAPVPTIPPAVLDDTLEITGESLAAKQIRTRMYVDVAVNGQGPFRFLVDSGADRSVIGAGLAARLGLPPGDPVQLQSMAGATRVETVVIDRLRLGNTNVGPIAAPALSEAFIGAQGLLGIDALSEQRLMVDFDAKRVTIEDPRRPEVIRADEIVVTAHRRRGQLILTQADVNGTPIYAVIDTGAELTMGNLALQARIFRGRRAPPSQPITLVSVTGQTIVANLVVMPIVMIGKIELRGVPVAFADAPPFKLFGLDRQPAMLLGTDVLQSFRRVALDFRGRKVRFVLRR